MRIALGLIHYPIWDSAQKIVATNVTNLDVHDIARACRVYGVERYYIIHPMQDQLMFVSRLLEHWRIGDGAKFNPMRRTALNMVHTAPSLENALQDWGGDPYVISTHARALDGVPQIGFRDLHDRICRARGLDLKGQPLPGMGEGANGPLTGAARGFHSGVRSGLEKNSNGRIFDGMEQALHHSVESVSALNRMAAARALAEAGPTGELTPHQIAAQKAHVKAALEQAALARTSSRSAAVDLNAEARSAEALAGVSAADLAKRMASHEPSTSNAGSKIGFSPAGVIKNIEKTSSPSAEKTGLSDADRDEEKIFLCFGTGFGLTEETMRACDYLLEPICGASSDDYRHLSVRSAVSICLDRLFGPW